MNETEKNCYGIDTILFDLDGTLLPIEAEDFERVYLETITTTLKDIIEPEVMARALWSSSSEMVSSKDETLTNEAVFYKAFERAVGKEIKDKVDAVLDLYYDGPFNAVEAVTTPSSEVIEAVAYLKSKGYRIILATNPLFPQKATDKRIQWAGLNLEDFEDITRFEKNHYCKPNLEYYQEIMTDNACDPRHCLMVGNDVEEDLIAQNLGMKVWLLEDNLIHRGTTIQCDWRGSRSEFLTKIKEEL